MFELRNILFYSKKMLLIQDNYFSKQNNAIIFFNQIAFLVLFLTVKLRIQLGYNKKIVRLFSTQQKFS